jgi:hypothetical protein
MRPVGVGNKRRSPHPSQAQAVAAWLGTYELLVEETKHLVGTIWDVGPSTLADAATAVLQRMDFEEPWIGRVMSIKEGEGERGV